MSSEPKHIKIIMEPVAEGVYLATSDAMPGFNAECTANEGMFERCRQLAMTFLMIDGELKPGAKVAFDFEIKEGL